MTPTVPEVGPGLFDGIEHPPVSDGSEREATLDEKFWAFHRDNPLVYQEFRSIALALHARGRKRAGAKAIIEILRWQRAMSTSDPDFKLNNSHVSRYARLLMAREPELQGFFSLRELRS